MRFTAFHEKSGVFDKLTLGYPEVFLGGGGGYYTYTCGFVLLFLVVPVILNAKWALGS